MMKRKYNPILSLRTLKYSIILLWLFAIAGCSSIKLGYDYADWYLVYRIDSFFDLNQEQEDFLNPRIDAFHAWHRKHELPRYILFLKETKSRFKDGLISEDITWIRSEYKKLRDSSANKLSWDTATFLSSVTEEQIQRMEGKLAERNAKVRGELELSEKELKAKYAENFFNTLDEWFGDLTDYQRRKIQALIELDKQALENDLNHQIAKQKKFAHLLREYKRPEEIEVRINEWFLKPELLRTPQYQQLVEHRVSKGRRLLMVFDGMILPRQREHALEKLQNYIDDLEDLVKESKAN